MGSPKSKNITVEALIRLKRAEKPSEEFWEDFEARFQEKKLHALIRSNLGFRWTWNFLFKWASLTVPALGALAFGVYFQVAQDPQHMDESGFAVIPKPLQVDQFSGIQETKGATDQNTSVPAKVNALFVTDSVQSVERLPSHFDKVLRNSAFPFRPIDSTRYVNDAFSARTTALETVKLSAGRHF